MQGLEPRINRADGTFAVIIAPTRELCIQIQDVLCNILRRYFWLVSLCNAATLLTESTTLLLVEFSLDFNQLIFCGMFEATMVIQYCNRRYVLMLLMGSRWIGCCPVSFSGIISQLCRHGCHFVNHHSTNNLMYPSRDHREAFRILFFDT